MSVPVEIDDPVADVLRWQRANERRAYLASEFYKRQERELAERQKILESVCHYCQVPATTRDHIVPRSRLAVVRDRTILNTVPACQPCNKRKADLRSDCRCPICVQAWAVLGPSELVDVRLMTMSCLPDD